MAGTLTFVFAITGPPVSAATDAQIATVLGAECLRVVANNTRAIADALGQPVTLTSSAVA